MAEQMEQINVEEIMQDILYYKTTPQLSTLAAAVVLGVGILLIGELVFVKLQKGFAEEL